MNLTELDHALRKLRMSGMADTLETRLLEAQSQNQAPIDMVAALVGDELVRRLSLIHISEPTRPSKSSRMPSSA